MATTLSIKNAPDDVVERLRQRAAKNHRSVQGELMAIVMEAVKPEYITPLELLAELRSRGGRTTDEAADIIRADWDRDEHRYGR